MSFVCGTGGWTGPLPGDPDNNSILTATPAFGGIEVAWTYPTINPHAVAHVKLFRGITSSFGSAITVAEVGGSRYYDKLDTGITYYYWIQIVSINGTVGDLIGPASSMARSLLDDLIEQLTGQIDEGVLATALQTKIDQISLLDSGLSGEIDSRIASDAALSSTMVAVQGQVGAVETLILNEVTARQDADGVMVSTIDAVQVGVDNNAATIANEQTVRAAEDEALATAISLVSVAAARSRTYRQTSAPSTGMEVGDLWFDTDDSNKAYRWDGTIWAVTDDARIAVNSAAIATESGVRASADSAFATQISTVSAVANSRNRTFSQTTEPATDMVVGDLWFDSDDGNKAYRYNGTAWVVTDDTRIAANVAAIQTEQTARATADSALATQITTAESTLNGSIASVQTTLQTNINTVDGKATNIGARYTVLVDVNGQVGGFGIYNDGTSVEAGFNVDKFWIGTTNTNRRKPFIISDGVVYIDEATIRDATIATAKITDAAVTTAKIGDAQITSAKIQDAQVGTLKIAGNAVTVGGTVANGVISVSDFYTGSLYTESDPYTLITLNLDPQSQPVFIQFKASLTTTGTGGYTNFLDLRVNGTIQRRIPFSSAGTDEILVTGRDFTYLATPPSGSLSITLTLITAYRLGTETMSVVTGDLVIFALGTKR